MGELTLGKIEELLIKQTAEINKNIDQKLKIVKRVEEKVEALEKKNLMLERRLRKNNIVIFGLTIDGSEIVEQVITKLNGLLNLEITRSHINNIYRIGKRNNPPVIIEFVSYLRKAEIFKNPEKLKALKGTKIAISNDLCEEDRETHKLLRKHLKLAREQNKQARIVGHRLEVENSLYTIDELENTETDLGSTSESGENKDIDDEETKSRDFQAAGGTAEKLKSKVGESKGRLRISPTISTRTRGKKSKHSNI